jgi:hypothetical protein
MRWWSREKGISGQQRQLQAELLRTTARFWGKHVRHVFDRGYGTGPWRAELSLRPVRFVVRWRKGNKLLDASGQSRKVLSRSPAANAPGARPGCCGIPISASIAAPVCSPCRSPTPTTSANFGWSWCDRAKGANPGTRLSNEPVETAEQAWEMAFSYVRRWKIEEQFRFQKTELLLESLRLQDWESRRKLFLLINLASGFLISMLSPPLWQARCRLRHALV